MYLLKNLSGDGRKTVTPQFDKYQMPTFGKGVSLSNCRRLIEAFKATGISTHHIPSSTGWVIEEWAKLNDVPITIQIDEANRFAVVKME